MAMCDTRKRDLTSPGGLRYIVSDTNDRFDELGSSGMTNPFNVMQRLIFRMFLSQLRPMTALMFDLDTQRS